MEALLGSSLVDKTGKEHALSSVITDATKAVGIYFSAHWCPPCRQFTPRLAEFYQDSLKNKGLEIIFVSSDKDEGAFKDYMGEMPWYALPFADRARKAKLSQKFKVEGIPTFVILDKNGEIITTEGRGAVMKDPKGTNFPWRPEPVLSILGKGKIVTQTGEQVPMDQLLDGAQAVGLYFSAHWCGPCKRFTPMLSDCYEKLRKQDQEAGRPQRLKIVFCSSDRDDAQFKEYFGHMPWHALDFNESSDVKEALEERFQVEGIPSFVVLDAKTGATLSDSGVQAVMSDPIGENFPWTPKPVQLLDNSTAGQIGPQPALFVFCGSDEKAKELQKDLITAVDVWQGRAEEGAVCHGDVCIPTGGKLEGADNVLFYVCGSNPIVQRVQDLAKADGVTVAILDLSGPVYAHSDIGSLEKATPMNLRKFVKGFLEGSVTKSAVKM